MAGGVNAARATTQIMSKDKSPSTGESWTGWTGSSLSVSASSVAELESQIDEALELLDEANAIIASLREFNSILLEEVKVYETEIARQKRAITSLKIISGVSVGVAVGMSIVAAIVLFTN